jgi:murein DD-endopeptidase MepM/ murein hydrolase activator NlpD
MLALAGAARAFAQSSSDSPLSKYALQPAKNDPANPPRTYVVAQGETLFGVASKFQIPLRALIDANRLDAPFLLKEGQVLRLPRPRIHLVAAGETLPDLARQFGIDARSLALLNRLRAPYAVKPGDRLVLPALARPLPAGEPKAPPVQVKQALPAEAGRFAWPLRGKVAVTFGLQPGKRRSDGIDIVGDPGGEVRASAAGRVVYAGADLPGYGHLLLIQHPNGWVTAYAHCARLTLSEGASVKRGDVVGYLEDTAEARLHFQIRRAGRPTDPSPLLAA